MRFTWAFGTLAVFLSSGCGGDLSEGLRPEFLAFIAGEPVPATATDGLHARYEFTRLTPGNGSTARARVNLLNNGGEPLRITRVLLEPTNVDGTPKSPWIVLDWGALDPSLLFCTTADLSSCGYVLESGKNLEFEVTYSPGDACSAAGDCEDQATLLVSHTEAGSPTRMEFGPPKCSRLPRVTPPTDTFFNASIAKPERKTFTITNTGSCGCAVNDVAFNTATSKFQISRAWTNGTELGPDDELTFEVTYTPTESGAADSVNVAVSFDCTQTPIVVKLDSKFETGTYEITYDNKENGFLDFTQVSEGCAEKVVSLYNVGPSSMQVQGWAVPEDTEGKFYTLSCQLPPAQEGANATPVPKPPAGLAAGRTLECTVKYCAATLAGKNATVVFTYANPAQGTIEVPAFGGQPKSCFEYAPGDAASDTPLTFYSTGKGEADKSRFVVYNCGNAELTVNAVRIEDAFLPGNPSKYFQVLEAPAFPLVLPVGGLQQIEVEMVVDDESPSVDGTLYVDYLDPQGTPVTSFGRALTGVVAPTVEPPIAVLELVGEAKLGASFTLTGQNSSGSIDDNGYLFYLLEKPAGSGVVVNGAPAAAAVNVTPDVAGKYRFALLVFSDTDPFYYSHEATLDVDVAP